MGELLGYSLPLLFLTLFATANLFITAVNGGDCCMDSKKSTLLIVFGDSFFDVGSGNGELCLPSGRKPYGKSLEPPGPTGRFSDGLLVPDYIAKYLGLAHEGKVAPYKSSFDMKTLHQGSASLSFAMARAGVTQSTEKSKSLTNQVKDFIDNSEKFLVGSGARCLDEQDHTLYLFSIGTYDYLAEVGNITNEQDVQEIAEKVTTAIVEEVKKIANAQFVRGKRFAFMSVSLRHLPVVQKVYHENKTQLNLLDKLETIHYNRLKDKLAELAQQSLKEGQDHMINYSILQYHSIIKAIIEAPEKYGYDETTVTSACCGDGSYRADGCGHSDEKGCNDPTAYVFWDGMHNTQHINREIARIFWNGPTAMVFPQNLHTLAGTQKPKYDFSVNANELISNHRTVEVVTIITTKEKVTNHFSS